MKPYLQCPNRKAWRAWLAEHHAAGGEVWLLYPKKGSGKAGIGYAESVEEAICYGWIDGVRKRVDADYFAHRFSPRKPRSKWSRLNIERAERLIAEGRMTRPGLLAFEARATYDPAGRETLASKEIPLTAEIEKALKRSPAAWKNFRALAPSYRKQYAAWLQSAKKAETRERRIAEAIARLVENRKLGMK